MPTYFSPAKINLFLRLVAKRNDGYHELSSLFQAIDLGDWLTVELSGRDHMTCTDLYLPLDKNNLVWKAVDLFRHKTGWSKSLCIHLDKRIPMQAGLGGGSGNAATVLWALNELSRRQHTVAELAAWSSEIGSDVPFFFSTGTAYCTGRGEKIESVALKHPLQGAWIVKPPIGLSTPAVYRCVTLKQMLDPLSAQKQDRQCALTGTYSYFNDLESPAIALCPQLGKLKRDLLACGFDTVLLCGSGSAFFCLGQAVPIVSQPVECYRVHFIQRHAQEWWT